MKKILLLDDNADFLEMMGLILRTRYEIRSVMNCADCEVLVQIFRPDLIILDYSFHPEDIARVLDLLEGISGKRIPFILCSAINDIKERATTMGANGYISKPSSISGIRKYIDDYFKYRMR